MEYKEILSAHRQAFREVQEQSKRILTRSDNMLVCLHFTDISAINVAITNYFLLVDSTHPKCDKPEGYKNLEAYTVIFLMSRYVKSVEELLDTPYSLVSQHMRQMRNLLNKVKNHPGY